MEYVYEILMDEGATGMLATTKEVVKGLIRRIDESLTIEDVGRDDYCFGLKWNVVRNGKTVGKILHRSVCTAE